MEKHTSEEKPLISVIIRSKNEEKHLPKVLESLKSQLFQNFEVILVDDHSKDKTLEIAKKFGCKIVNIPDDKKFSHGLSCNLEAENASGKYLVYLNGHSIPISNKFLESGLKNFEDEKVAGVYAMPIAHKDGTLADIFLHNIAAYTLGSKKFKANENTPGVLATINAMIRKDLWEKSPYKEDLNGGMGGEDTVFAKYVLDNGYYVIHDPEFRVRHSHHLKFKDIKWQRDNRNKMKLGNETPEVQRKYF